MIEPLKQLLNRASTGNGFWMYLLEDASFDQRRVSVIRTMLRDYTETTPERMQALAQKYLTARPGYRLAIIPEGQELATAPPAGASTVHGAAAAAGR